MLSRLLEWVVAMAGFAYQEQFEDLITATRFAWRSLQRRAPEIEPPLRQQLQTKLIKSALGKAQSIHEQATQHLFSLIVAPETSHLSFAGTMKALNLLHTRTVEVIESIGRGESDGEAGARVPVPKIPPPGGLQAEAEPQTWPAWPQNG
ncbi:gll1031 [Gloeobacter violaceus PCC 7421]|uniref:Gll1031 protein n=2 Tax=Gloeobacter violaceus TaxID=33072 RepID=Q7NLU0_GLOVI|nr:gll1031 [Gloeobacter violaceus PCC 7421]